MQLHKIIKILILLLTVLYCSYVRAEDVLLPEEEASPVLYSGSLGDADVELFMSGSWQLDASYGTTFPLAGSLPVSHPEIIPGFYFRQIPDLTISLWLLNRYFIETSFYPGFENNTYVLGYRGEDGDFIKSVRIGNKGLSVPSRQLLSIPAGSARGFGGYIHFGTEEWDNHMLLRYDSYARETVEYKGTSEIFNLAVPLEEYLRGSGFLLPDSDVTNVTVFIQSYSGGYSGDDGLSYEIADPDTYLLIKESGYIQFSQEIRKKILVHYSTAFGEVGAPGGGVDGLTGTTSGSLDAYAAPQDFSWSGTYLGQPLSQYRVQLTGPSAYTTLAIWDGGSFSPFEAAADYNIPSIVKTSRVSGYIKGPDSDTDEMAVLLDPDDGRVHIVAPENMPDAGRRFPLTQFISSYYQGISGSLSGYELNIQQLLPMQSIPVPGNAIPGSLSVFVNGIKSNSYTIRNGSIDFPFPLRENDTVKILYSRENGETNTLLQTSSHRYSLTDNLIFTGSSAFMWALPKSSSSDYYGQYPGLVAGNIGFEYTNEVVEVSVNYSASIGSEDSAGRLLLSNFIAGAVTQSPGGNILPPVPSTAFPANERVLPLYRDFRLITDGGITFLQDITSSTGQKNVAGTGTGSQVGPYAAKADSLGMEGIAAVAEADLPVGEWTGFTLVIDDTDIIPDSLSFDAAFQGTGEIDLYIRIGALSEDTDMDGNLDEESSAESSGFLFSESGDYYRFGGGIVYPGNGYLETEDINGDGSLTPEVSSLVYESPMIDTLSQASGLQHYSIEFTDSQKAMLRDLRGIQVLARNSGPSSASGRLIAGEFLLNSQGVRIEGDSGTSTYDEDSEQLTFDWSGGVPPNSVSIPVASFPLKAYREMEFTWSLPQSAQNPADAVFRIHTGASSSYEALVQLPVNSAWHEARFDLESMSLFIDTTEYQLTASGPVIPSRKAKVSSISIEFPSSASGSFKMTKPYAVSPVSSIDHGIQTKASLDLPDLTPWLGLRMDSDITAASGNVGNTLIPELSAKHLRILEEQNISLPGTKIVIEEDILIEETEPSYGWGHGINLSPLRWLTLTDRFRRSDIENDFAVSAANTLVLSGWLGAIDGFTEIRGTREEYTHSMGSGLQLPLGQNSRIELKETLNYKLQDEIMGADYWNGYSKTKERLFSPRSQDAFYRKTETSADYSYVTGTDSRFVAGASLSSVNSYSPLPSSNWIYMWNLRYTFPLNSGSITIHADQESTIRDGWDKRGDLYTDKVRLFNNLSEYYRTLLAFPVYHMYPYLYSAAEAPENTYIDIESRAGAGIGRRPVSSIIQLLIPVRLEYNVQRNVTLHETSIDDGYVHTAALKWEGRNLFGSYGRYRIFELYQSEDLYTYASSTYDSRDSRWTFDVSSQFVFFNNAVETADISHEFIYSGKEYSDTIGIKGYWDVPIKERRFFHDRLLTRTVRNTEELTGKITWDSEKNSQDLTIKHSSDLVFSEQGTLGVYLKAGILRKNIAGSVRTGLGMELGMRGKLSF